MARFEDAIQWLIDGGIARRRCWARIPQYTQATPPMMYEKMWRIWQNPDVGGLVQGWGGQIGMQLDPGDPIRDGTNYQASDEDRVATDWELLERVRPTPRG